MGLGLRAMIEKSENIERSSNILLVLIVFMGFVNNMEIWKSQLYPLNSSLHTPMLHPLLLTRIKIETNIMF